MSAAWKLKISLWCPSNLQNIYRYMFRNLSKIFQTRDQRGMTLIELMTATVIASLLLAMISFLLVRTFYVNKYTLEQALNTTTLRNSLKNLTTNLREARQSDAGGYMIASAQDFDLVFFSNVDDDSATERVHYYLQNGQLKMGIAEASGFPLVYPAGDQETKIIGQGIINNSSQPVFRYYNEDYPVDTINNPLVNPISLEEVSLIKIDIFANVDPNNVPDNMRIETFVRPRNIK